MEIERFLIYLLVSLNLFFCLIVVTWNIYYYFFIVDHVERWTKIFYSCVGFSWFIRFVLFFFDVHPFGINEVNSAILILLTFTLLSMALASMIRVLKVNSWREIRNNIRNLFTASET